MTKPHINVTPLIDVLLVLLIIFMVVTPMKPSAFESKVPKEQRTKPDRAHPWTLVVVVESDRTLRLNLTPLSASIDDPKALVEELRRTFETRRVNMAFIDDTAGSEPRIEKTVFIKAPRSLDYGSVARVIDAVKLAGADPVSLQLDELE